MQNGIKNFILKKGFKMDFKKILKKIFKNEIESFWNKYFYCKKKKNIISLIRYYAEKNDDGFRNEAYEIAKDYGYKGTIEE